ncbi:hypothetical protein Tco_1478209 [Tanacetum coccineum]
MIRNKNAKFAAFKQEIDTLKQTLSKHVKEKESLMTTFIFFKMESKEKENKYIDKEIDLENKIKELDNIVHKVELNKLSEHFGKHFVPPKELSAEQAFWLPISDPIFEQLVVQPTPVKIEVPIELPKESFKNFYNGLYDELNEVKMVFDQIEAAVEQCSVHKKRF